MENIKITPEGFVWYIIDKDLLIELYNSGKITLNELHDDGSESIIDNANQIFDLRHKDCNQVGIEIGHLEDLNKLYNGK